MLEYKTTKNTDEELFELLCEPVKKWFKQKFKTFAPPQQYAILDIHSRQNILVSAPTGCGKTLTAMLSILNELVGAAQKGILEDKTYCVYTNPLKALSRDVFVNLIEPLQEIEEIIGKKLNIRIAVRTGDTSQKEKAQMLKHPPHILITTPESLAILLASIKFKEHIKQVEWLIIDEIHALAENKRGTHLALTVERLQRLNPGMCRIGLSATVSPLEEIAKFLVGKRKCKIVNIQFIKDLDIKVMSPVKDLINTSYENLNNKTYELIDKLIQEHKTTLIFTNTRAGTERIVHYLKEKFPKKYMKIDDQNTQIKNLIGAHHGSLSKAHRLNIEEKLRKGELKAIVCSTSLELGIDIGYIDLVILLGSPKSVARLLQRSGRSGHKLHQKTKARIVVQDRDDLIECSVMLKNAIEKKIDNIHIPKNCLDVLAQQIMGMCLEEVWDIEHMYNIIKKSYPYKNLKRTDFNEVIDYLAGEYTSLEDRYVYAKIWKEENKIGRRGRLARVIYMTNIGTIPEQHGILVKQNQQTLGVIDENFLEKLKTGDIFVLGGSCYEFRHAKGTVAQVRAAHGRKPTVPSWYSEMLPLSFDLASDIQKFRKLLQQRIKNKTKSLDFIKEYLYTDNNAAQAIYNYFKEQNDYLETPHQEKLLIEHFKDENKTYHIFHSLYGRRVNDCLSRSIAYAIAFSEHKDVEVGINDNGFYITSDKTLNINKAIKLLKAKELEAVLRKAIDKSEILKRRFRHCAARSLMILRNYKGRKTRVGRQQVRSMILLSAVRRISNDFVILREARREVLEDLMDVKNATKILNQIELGKIKIKEQNTVLPSPFAFNLVMQGYTDILKMEDKVEFLKQMHKLILAKISLKK